MNGRLVLEGALRIYWGVVGVIHLKEEYDQRTVVTVRKRNSYRYSNGNLNVSKNYSHVLPAIKMDALFQNLKVLLFILFSCFFLHWTYSLLFVFFFFPLLFCS